MKLTKYVHDVWEGFQAIGVMNGLPAVPEQPQSCQCPQVTTSAYATVSSLGYDPDHDPTIPMREFAMADGTHRWRHPGLGSV